MQLSRKKRGVGAVLVTAVVAGLVASLLIPAAGASGRHGSATASGGTINVAGMGFAQNFADAGVGAAGPVPGREREQRSQGLEVRLQGIRRRQQRPEHRPGGSAAPGHPGGRAGDRARGLGGHAERLPHPAADPVVRLRLRRELLHRRREGLRPQRLRLPHPGEPEAHRRGQLGSAQEGARHQGHRQADGRVARHRHDVGQAERAELGFGRDGCRLRRRVRQGCVPRTARGRG